MQEKKKTLPAIEDGEGSLESGGGGGATSCGSAVVFDSLVCRDDRDLDRTWLESNLSRNSVVVFSSSTSGYGSDENIHTHRDREFLRHTAFSSQKINCDVQTLKSLSDSQFLFRKKSNCDDAQTLTPISVTLNVLKAIKLQKSQPSFQTLKNITWQYMQLQMICISCSTESRWDSQ